MHAGTARKHCSEMKPVLHTMKGFSGQYMRHIGTREFSLHTCMLLFMLRYGKRISGGQTRN